MQVSGPCTLSGDCVQSPNYPSTYGNRQQCSVHHIPPFPAVVLAFNVEVSDGSNSYDVAAGVCFDYVTISGQ
eukprot:505010-Prymnesium_polylepis.1